jgi:rifampicin phosphotransferase
MRMTTTSTGQMRSLAEVGIDDIALVGSKAATLATLKQAGFPVPDGVVLTTEALDYALTMVAAAESVQPADIEAMQLPAELMQALATAVDRLQSDRLAVRSSGVDEDLPGA